RRRRGSIRHGHHRWTQVRGARPLRAAAVRRRCKGGAKRMRARTVLPSLGALAAALLSHPSEAKGPRPMSYGEMVRSWHAAPPSDEQPASSNGRPPLVLEMINTKERIELTPLRDDGGFSADDLERASQ